MYETVENIRARLPKITGEVRDDEFVANCIQSAQAEVDGRIGVRYETPLSEPPDDIITYITSSLAQSLLLESVYSSDTPFIGDLVRSLRERADLLLNMIAEGKVTLSGAEKKSEPATGVDREGLSKSKSDESEFYAPDEALK